MNIPAKKAIRFFFVKDHHPVFYFFTTFFSLYNLANAYNKNKSVFIKNLHFNTHIIYFFITIMC